MSFEVARRALGAMISCPSTLRNVVDTSPNLERWRWRSADIIGEEREGMGSLFDEEPVFVDQDEISNVEGAEGRGRKEESRSAKLTRNRNKNTTKGKTH